MIRKGNYDYYGRQMEFISIDLSDKKHPNRVIHFLETRHPITQAFTCDVEAKWSTGNLHPSLTMKKEDVLALAHLFSEWAERIRDSDS